METTIWILSIILYVFMGIIVAIKQFKAIRHDVYGAEGAAFFLAIVWPITLIIYTIRVWFFEDWI